MSASGSLRRFLFRIRAIAGSVALIVAPLETGAANAVATDGTGHAILPVPYQSLKTRLPRVIDFETLPRRAEPGFNLDARIRTPGARLGERFRGQPLEVLVTRNGHRFDHLTGRPTAPLQILPGRAGSNLAVALHRGFGSNAVFPLGPDGFDLISGRGEGSLAILFDTDQVETGFRFHTDYPDPLGQKPARRGAITVIFLRRDGSLIGRTHSRPGPGITELGFRRKGGARDIAGMVILNNDPGGIAIDDIVHDDTPLLGLGPLTRPGGTTTMAGNHTHHAGAPHAQRLLDRPRRCGRPDHL